LYRWMLFLLLGFYVIIIIIECCRLEKSLNVENHYELIKSEIFFVLPAADGEKEHYEVVHIREDSIILFRDRNNKALTRRQKNREQMKIAEKSRICK
jgi:hypothetical protein